MLRNIKKLSWKHVAYSLLLFAFALSIWVLILGNAFGGRGFAPNFTRAKDLQPFFTGMIVPLLSLGGTLLVLENLRNTSLQNFSNNFLKLIDQHHKLVDNIADQVDGVTVSGGVTKGRDFFDYLAERIACDYKYIGKLQEEKTPVVKERSIYVSIPGKEPAEEMYCEYDFNPSSEIEVTHEQGIERLKEIYLYYYEIHQSSLGHYFRNLFHIIQYADNAPFRSKVKQEHMAILRAQLSNYELLILAYHSCCEDEKQFAPLLEEYLFLKYLNMERALAEGRVRRIIDPFVLTKFFPRNGAYLLKQRGMTNIGKGE